MPHTTLEPRGLITNIQKYTIHDGPGIRTEIFFKGCPMRCLWCSNPETQSARPQIGVYPTKCLTHHKCGYCAAACLEAGRVIFGESGAISDVRAAPECGECLKCAEACPSGALKRWGDYMTVTELMSVILEDVAYYEKSGGGVTLSGGEVMMQHEFALSLLRACKNAGIHTCVESALHCPAEHMDAVLELTDLLITDIKHMDAAKHRAYTGVSNELILSNIKRASKSGVGLVIRTPVVSGYNSDDDNIRATGAFIRDELRAVRQFQLLPYRKMGTEKYESLRIPYPMGDYAPPERAVWESELTRLAGMLRSEFGVTAVAGSGAKL